MKEDLQQMKDPFLQLADYEKKQIQSRNFMVKKYLMPWYSSMWYTKY